MDETSLGHWLTLDELGARTGRKVTGLRTWAQRRRRDGRHSWRKNNGGEWTVQVTPDVLADLGSDSSGGALLTEHDMANALAEARDALVEARIETASTKGELAAEVRRNADLLVALAKAEARADRLAAELAEARKPVLLRLVEALRRR